MRKISERAHKSFVSVGLIAALLFVVFSGFLTGCNIFGSDIESIEFRNSVLSLDVGESVVIDSAYITFTPSTVSDKSFTLGSSDENIVSVREIERGYKITGVSAGSAVITARTRRGAKTADCTVNVSLPEPTEMSIGASGKLFQRAGDMTAVDFSAKFDVLSPDKTVKWNIISGLSVVSHLSAPQKESFVFAPETAYAVSDGGVGLYTVTAQAVGKDGKKLSATETLGVYYDYVSPPALNHVSGDPVQNDGEYTGWDFSVSYTDNPQNPDRYIEWFVNGETAQTNGNRFEFYPASAGVYTVTAAVNGEMLSEKYTVTAKGSIVPSGLKLEYDNCFPKVMLSWDSAFAGLDYEVDIKNASGSSILTDRISTKNGSTAALFSKDKKSVDLSDYIGIDSRNSVFEKSLSFRVRSLGDGKDFTESDYCEPLASDAIGGADARQYLEKKYYDGAKNHYVTSDDEFVDLFAYLFLWRNSPVLGFKQSERLTADMYMAYEPDDVSELITYAFDVLHFTGRNRFEYKLSGNVLSLTIVFETDSLPSQTYPRDPVSVYRGGSNAVRPHFDTDGKTRSKLPIENRAQAVTVTTSEQLYYISQLGYKPVFSGNCTAKTIYDYAAAVLKRIVSDDMTDVEKAHAIYDWVMLQVDYDHGVVGVSSLERAVKYSAYYLEGVFNDDGAAAVCDGISKAYALMCNMENIPCMRVTGVAGADYDAENRGGHAWNKVKVNGEWYIVDCTWGDESAVLWDNARVYHEMAYHRYFLLTDREVERTHGEDVPNKYPETSVKPYNWYDDEIEFEYGTVDLYIDCGEDKASAEAKEIVDYIEYCRREDPLYRERYSPYEGKYLDCAYISFDIRISNSLKNVFLQENNPFSAAFARLGYKPSDYKIVTDETPDAVYIFITIKTRY